MNEYERVCVDGGAMYESAERWADYEWLAPGVTEIHLEGDGLKLTGWIKQSEKAGDVCEEWMRYGIVSDIFHMVNRPPKEWIIR